MRAEKNYYVYIMASRSLTLYTGVTGNIFHRAQQHKAGEIDGFTKKYHINRLVYYETFKYVNNALAREKQIKAWTRAKRLALIKTMNPTWQDLAEDWGEPIKLQIPHSVRDDKELSVENASKSANGQAGERTSVSRENTDTSSRLKKIQASEELKEHKEREEHKAPKKKESASDQSATHSGSSRSTA